MSNYNIFRRGFDAVHEEQERSSNRNNSQKLWRFFLLNTGDEATLRFLTEEPVNFYEHTIKEGNTYKNYLCTGGNDCPYCRKGDRASFKGAFLVVDKRKFSYTDKNGNRQVGDKTVRLFVQGTKVLSQLDRIHTKYGLSNRDVVIERLGKDNNTSYFIEHEDKSTLTPEEIRELLPDFLKSAYEGTIESLMTIVENQLLETIDDIDQSDNSNKYIVSVDDEEEGLPFGDVESPKSIFKVAENQIRTEDGTKKRLKLKRKV